MQAQIDFAINELRLIISNNSVCKSHGLEHAITVMNHSVNALKVCKQTLDEETQLAIILASLLHDADDHKFFPKNKNNENTRYVLRNYSQEFVNIVLQMIEYVSCSKNGDSVPTDAISKPYLLYPRHSDRLEAVGDIGCLRCLQYAQTIKLPLFLADTSRVTTEEELWKVATAARYSKYKGNSISMVDHYYDKLLRLGKFDTDNDYYMQESRNRIQPLINVVLQFGLTGTFDNTCIAAHINKV